ncbi:hypothetical protein DFJ73DRAFT_145938 [Zopfochytrium polystomum]|nr:hypothetical protein DFJ73DRAFT_145938 [Zopfochytrium polystomum]
MLADPIKFFIWSSTCSIRALRAGAFLRFQLFFFSFLRASDSEALIDSREPDAPAFPSMLMAPGATRWLAWYGWCEGTLWLPTTSHFVARDRLPCPPLDRPAFWRSRRNASTARRGDDGQIRGTTFYFC